KVEYVEPRLSHHYEITPYSFAPKLAKKLVPRTYLDLSQGILDCMHSIYKDKNPLPSYDGLVVSAKTRNNRR
ncbi:MAG: hypothetical protein PHT32_07055, partial [Candidatus Omnitrophica bacterium]|nr:hypothetical protein [Candidatus Omnitrophota bacterium]